VQTLEVAQALGEQRREQRWPSLQTPFHTQPALGGQGFAQRY
jgi:hypothetical protein